MADPATAPPPTPSARTNILTRFNLILGVLLAVIRAGETGLLPGRRGRPARADRPAPRVRHHLPGRGEKQNWSFGNGIAQLPSDPRSSPAGLPAQFRIWGYGVPTLRLSRRLSCPGDHPSAAQNTPICRAAIPAWALEDDLGMIVFRRLAQAPDGCISCAASPLLRPYAL